MVGLLRGADPALKDTYLIVTGHYDHLGMRDNGTPDRIYNGANDDASGTASVIEIANAMGALPRPKRSILFMTVFGEEKGDLGSKYYGAHPIFPLAKTVVDLNLEQLGRTDDLEGPRVGAFNMTGFDYTNLPAIFARATALTDIKAVKHDKTSDSYFRRSDNAAFADVGVPSTTISVAYDYDDNFGGVRLSGLPHAGRRVAEDRLRKHGQGGPDHRAGDDRNRQQRRDAEMGRE